MARPELIFEFLARYELDVLEHRRTDSAEPVYVFPDAIALHATERSVPELSR